MVPRNEASSRSREATESRNEPHPVPEVARSLKTPHLYGGRIQHIHAPTVIDVSIATEFAISFTQRCLLYDVAKIEAESPEFVAAKTCLIMLLGGRDVVVETIDAPKRANMVQVLVYRKGSVPPSDCNVTIDDVDYINVNRYMTWLASHSKPFDRNLVAQHRKNNQA